MYSTAPRLGIQFKPTTNEFVGPNTYFISCSSHKRVNVAPFLSSDKRKSLTEGIEGSGSGRLYNVKTASAHIKGGSSLKNTSRRFVYKGSDTPGPESYYPKDTKKCHKVKVSGNNGKLYACRVPYTTQGSAPSIPTKIHKYGYQVDKFGNIKANEPLFKPDETLGPAFYEVKHGTPCENYKGCKWSSRSEKRTSYSVGDGPGPTTYDLELPVNLHKEKDEKHREMARVLSFLPRYLEDQVLKTVKENKPGPGHYQIRTPSCTSSRSRSINPRPFVSGTSRFKNPITACGPSPDSYDITSNARPKISRFSAFGYQSPRFPRRNIVETPGPASYDIKSPIIAKLEGKINKYSSKRVPFNNTERRDARVVIPDGPSPSDYHVKFNEKCYKNPCSVFTSKTKRFDMICRTSEKDEIDVMDAFRKMNTAVSHNVADAPFNGKSRRKTELARPPGPGPADYLGKGDIGSRGHTFCNSPRFETSNETTPGPGEYKINPYLEGSLEKAFVTKNVSLKENVLRKKLHVHPDQTRECWEKYKKKSKKLRWFVNGGKHYKHCL